MSPQLISLMIGRDHAVPVEVNSGTATVTVDNTGGTVYYADNPQVSSTSNQGSISPGGQAIFTSPAWLIGSSTAGVTVTITSVYDEWAVQTPGLAVPMPSVIHAYGHSYVSGNMSNPTTNRQTAKLATACSGSETNKGVGSSILCTQNSLAGTVDTNTAPAGIVGVLQNITAARTPGTDPFLSSVQCAVLCWGINDWAVMGAAQFATSFPMVLHTAIRRFRAGAVFEDADASVTYPVGTWTLGSGTAGNSGAGNHSCTQTAGTVQLAVPSQYQGQAITIGFIDIRSPYTVTVTDENGVNRGSIIMGGFGFTQTQSRNVCTSLSIPAGALSAGSHTLSLSYTQAGSSAMFFDYWSIESTPAPLVLLELANRIPNWSAHASGWPNAPLNDASVTTMNGMMQQVAAAYPDGRVVCVPTDDIINNRSSFLTSDGVHPNSNAAGLIAQRMVQAIQAANSGRSDLLQLGTA